MAYRNSDKRRYIRYEMLDYVHVNSERSTVRAMIVDLGLGGLQIRSRNPMPIGHRCEVVLPRNDGTDVTFRVEVMHNQRVDDEDLQATGFQFRPETCTEQTAIAELVHSVFQKQCELLR